MARFCPLFSSSKGNSVYIGNTSGGILVDAGTNAKQIAIQLENIGADINKIHALFITHEHTDHISALRVLCSRHGIPVYSSPGTYRYLEEKEHLKGNFFSYILQGSICVGDMLVTPFATSHDCCEGYGYKIELPEGKTISVLTDTGYISEAAKAAVQGSDLVYLESNHDVKMLESGPYPYVLKRRILSDEGHLSNDVASTFAAQLLQGGTSRFVLAHLSEENNMPQLARQSVVAAMSEIGASDGSDFLLSVAKVRNDEKMIVL